jgi:hypothetical protein
MVQVPIANISLRSLQAEPGEFKIIQWIEENNNAL